MSEHADDLSAQFKGTQSSRSKGRNWSEGGGRTRPRYQCLGIAPEKSLVRYFKLMTREGRVTALPYALLPVIIYDPDRDLKIKASGYKITIVGRGLQKIEEWMSLQLVLWIREGMSTDDLQEDVFVSQISIEEDEV